LPKGCHAKLLGLRRDAGSTFEGRSALKAGRRRAAVETKGRTGLGLRWSMIPRVALIRLRRGRPINARSIMRIFVVAAMLALASPASAHDYWSDGRRVDPVTKNLCCSGADTKELDASLVKQEKGGYLLIDTNEFIPFERVQPSPDSAIWVSRWGGTSKCFFYPSSY
jgi:hypothetical protein